MNTANGGPEMTTDELKELIGKVTPCWRYRIDGFASSTVIADVDHENDFDSKHPILRVNSHHNVPFEQECSNMKLAALAPQLARKVIAAEKLADAVRREISRSRRHLALSTMTAIAEYEATK